MISKTITPRPECPSLKLLKCGSASDYQALSHRIGELVTWPSRSAGATSAFRLLPFFSMSELESLSRCSQVWSGLQMSEVALWKEEERG